MAKKKKVEAVEEIVDVKQEEVVEETPQAEEPKVKNEVLEDGTVKVDLRQSSEVESNEDADVAKVEIPAPEIEEPVEEIAEQTTEELVEDAVEEIALEEVTEIADKLEENIEEAIEKAEEQGTQLPENIQKVIDFMDETGGTLEDYVELNKDYSKMSDNDLLKEYFKQTKPHLTDEERSFVMEDLYSYDEELDEERDIKRKKLALKEQVANAKNHLDGLKSKYYDEIKAGSRLNPEQQKAIDFFNRYNKNQTVTNRS